MPRTALIKRGTIQIGNSFRIFFHTLLELAPALGLRCEWQQESLYSTSATGIWSGWLGDKLSAIGNAVRLQMDEEKQWPTAALLYPSISLFSYPDPPSPLFHRPLWRCGLQTECLGFDLGLALQELIVGSPSLAGCRQGAVAPSSENHSR